MPSDPSVPLTLQLRPAEPADRAALADLFLAAREAAFPAMPRSIHPPVEVHAWFRERLAGRAGQESDVWLAELPDAAAPGGVAGYLVLDGDWLDSLYVRPGLTGHGIGGMLLDLAKTLRPDGFALWVFETNADARRFYLRHGLLELEHTDGRDNEEQAPDLRMAWPGRDPVGFLRRQVDEVDTGLGRLLARRTALTAAIQRFNRVPGTGGRDSEREAAIVARLAEQAPVLGRQRLARIVHAVITETLDAVEQR